MNDEDRKKAEEWEAKVRPDSGMQQYDYWAGAYSGFLAGIEEGRKSCVISVSKEAIEASKLSVEEFNEISKQFVTEEDYSCLPDAWSAGQDCEKAYRAGLEEGRRSQWVKCSERMPEMPGDYLAYREPNEEFWPSMSVRRWEGDRWETKQTITHWSPLPPPPGEESRS